jgi:hypothetical protein
MVLSMCPTGVMSEDALIRYDNLDALVKARNWTPTDLALAVGRKYSQVSDMLRREKSFGEKIARDFEHKLQLPRMWLDQIHDEDDPHLQPKPQGTSEAQGVYNVEQPPQQTIAASDTKWLRAPVVAWARLGVELYRANNEWHADEMQEFITAHTPSGERFKMIEVPDSRLGPRIAQGDFVVIDPDQLTAKRNQVVLVKGPDDELMLRRFRPLANNGFEVVDASGEVLDKARHGLEILGVAIALVQHDL